MGRNSDKVGFTPAKRTIANSFTMFQVTGIVPKGALVPSLEEPSFLCFFDVPTKSELEKATQVAEDNGCETFLKNFHIEGTLVSNSSGVAKLVINSSLQMET